MKISRILTTSLCVLSAALCSPAIVAQAQARTPAKAPEKVSFSMSSTSMLNLPVYVADVMGYFKNHGIEPNFIQFHKGGATALAAVISGNVNLYIGSTGSAIRAVQSGTDAVIIGTVMSEISLNIVMSGKAAQQRHVTADTPVQQRIAALKGLKIGVTGAGGATHQVIQYALKSAGMDPTRDATLAFVGSGADMLGAMSSGNVDAIVGANPTSDMAILQHHGVLLVNGTTGEYPGLKGMAQLVAVTTHRWANKNPELARRTMASVQDGQRAIRNPDVTNQARELVHKKYFSGIDKDVFDSAWKNVIPAFPDSPRFSLEQVTRNIDFLNAFSEDKYEVDAARVYSEKYLP